MHRQRRASSHRSRTAGGVTEGDGNEGDGNEGDERGDDKRVAVPELTRLLARIEDKDVRALLLRLGSHPDVQRLLSEQTLTPSSDAEDGGGDEDEQEDEDEDELEERGSAIEGLLMLLNEFADPVSKVTLAFFDARTRQVLALPESDRWLTQLPKKERAAALQAREQAKLADARDARVVTRDLVRQLINATDGLVMLLVGGTGLAAHALGSVTLSTPLLWASALALGGGVFAFVPRFFQDGHVRRILPWRRRHDGDDGSDRTRTP